MHYLYLMAEKYGTLDYTNGYIYFKMLFKMNDDINRSIVIKLISSDIENIQVSDEAFDEFFKYENPQDNQNKTQRLESNHK